MLSDARLKGEPVSIEILTSHLGRSLDNAQSTIRFLDTKAGAILALIPVAGSIFALLLRNDAADIGLIEWFIKLDRELGALRMVGYLVMLAVVFSQLYLTMISALRALSPQGIGDAKCSVLFAHDHPSFPSRLRMLCHKPFRHDLLDDYRYQLARLSTILAKKMENVDKAIGHARQFGFSLAALVACSALEVCIVYTLSSFTSN